LEVGQAVWVPFGDKLLQGIVLELTDYPAVEETREIVGIIEPPLQLSPQQVLLAHWISEYYLSPLFDAVALMLPPGFERKVVTFISCPPSSPQYDEYSLNAEQTRIFDYIQGHSKLSLKALEREFGKKKAQTTVSQLVRLKLVARSYEMEPVKVKPKKAVHLRLNVTVGEARQEIDRLWAKRALKQAALLEFLVQQTRRVSWEEARKQIGATKAAADALVSKGLVSQDEVEVKRDPISYKGISSSEPLSLTPAQRAALESIKGGLLRSADGASSGVFLLHGVTGSGKTEIYLQALAETVKLGKKGIVLVPEISLTPQTIERFAARFPGRVGVLHSQLTLGEQFDQWWQTQSGEFDVVIGPRSAVFAPQPDLGLIVIDEEYEWTYKQADKSPRYHARDVALKLGELAGAVVVLGSATPDIETCYRARRGDYYLLEMPERVAPDAGSPLPLVEVVDLREELKAGNRSPFSRALSKAIYKALAGGEQVILFVNRRGAASLVQCRECGYAFHCRRCGTALTYHPDQEKLVCHHCNYRMSLPQACPQCGSRRIKYLGIGTQRLVQEAGYAFPHARVLRWDSDATRGRHDHEEILSRFRAHEADILIGTQMIAKGLDIPLITLVGVVNADTGLSLPDFRAGERTFQLLSQVAGRAGRGVLGGRVIIQTYSPDNYAIRAAAKHDYSLFYEQEMAYRRQLGNPPFSQLASLVYSHTNEVICRREAERMQRVISTERDARGIDNVSPIGPAPAFVYRVRGRFRWQLILRGSGLATFLSDIAFPQGWTVDIDPVGLV